VVDGGKRTIDGPFLILETMSESKTFLFSLNAVQHFC